MADFYEGAEDYPEYCEWPERDERGLPGADDQDLFADHSPAAPSDQRSSSPPSPETPNP